MRMLSLEPGADSVNEYPLVFSHMDGRKERFSSQQTLPATGKHFPVRLLRFLKEKRINE